jgi:hypothetical protein
MCPVVAGLQGTRISSSFPESKAPEFRASLRAIATACLRLLSFLPLPDFSVLSLCSFMTLWTLRFPLEDDVATACSFIGWHEHRFSFRAMQRPSPASSVTVYAPRPLSPVESPLSFDLATIA